jgi:hypothetical protein
MNTQEAMRLLKDLVPRYGNDIEECQLVGMAVAVLVNEGYHDFEFEPTDCGGLKLRTGNIELFDERDGTPRGEIQRHIQLLVRAAVMA